MKKFVMALALFAIAPMYVAYGDTGTTKTTKVYRRASTTQQKATGYDSPVTNNFYYSQSKRRKYRAASNNGGTVIRREVVRDYGNDNYETVNREYEAAVQKYEMPSRGTEVPNRDYGDSYVATSYDDYINAKKEREYSEAQVQTETNTSETRSYVKQERKYFLAHPFFQPLRNRFGSVTDIAFAKSKFEFDMLNASVLDIDPANDIPGGTYGTVIAEGPINASGRMETSQFLVKEDFSFGITDQLAIIAMGQYDSTKVNLKDWSDGSPETEFKDSGLNVFGFGAQWRFVDTPKVIGMLNGYYESQKDAADSFLGDLKLGYKIDRTTVYGVARAGYSRLKNGDIYGAYIEDETGDWLMFSYKTNVKDVFYVEGGLGLFSVLNKYFTVNAEVFLGNYDWHNEVTAKAAIGVQPFDSFALNLYATGVLYDSANNKIKEYMNYDQNPVGYPSTNLVYTTGDYKIKNYNEYKIGAQIIFHF